MRVDVERSSRKTATVSWSQSHRDTEVCISLRDVTEIVFPNQAGKEFTIPYRFIIPEHTYHVTVRGVTTGAQLVQPWLPTDQTIHWQLDDSQVDITVRDVTQPRLFPNQRGQEFRVPDDCIILGHTYQVTVRGETSEGMAEFRAEFTPRELSRLYARAKKEANGREFEANGREFEANGREFEANGREFEDQRFSQTIFFYRNKPGAYFNMCRERCNNTMKMYTKDYNGDAASIINGHINGLFFCANAYRDTELPPPSTNFGERRVCIPAANMLIEYSDLYFADFYCWNRSHYVTLVLTRPGSETDRFCEEKLIKLDKGDNDFLRRSSNGKVFVSSRVWVEVLYTEDIDLGRPDCYFSTVANSRGTSTPGGLLKNPYCATCNLGRS